MRILIIVERRFGNLIVVVPAHGASPELTRTGPNPCSPYDPRGNLLLAYLVHLSHSHPAATLLHLLLLFGD